MDRGPPRALHLLAPTSAASCSTSRSASTTTGRLLGLDVRFWHDNGAYTPYGIIVPIITSTQLLGPYKPGAYRVEFDSLYTNTVIVTPYRGAGRPQGCFAMERTMDAIADDLGLDRAEVRAAQLHPARRVPLRPRPDLPGRPAADLRLRRLPGVAGEAQGRWSAGTTSPRYRERGARREGRRVGIGLACYVEGTGVGPYEGAHVQVETTGKVKVATGLTTRARATRRCSPRSSPTSSACRSRTSR